MKNKYNLTFWNLQHPIYYKIIEIECYDYELEFMLTNYQSYEIYKFLKHKNNMIYDELVEALNDYLFYSVK